VTDDRNDAVDGQPLDEVTGPNESDEPRDESPPEPPEPTPEELAERAARADKSISRALAGVLWLEAVCVLLVPRAIAQTSVGLTGVKTGLLIGFAIVLVAAGILVRRRFGIAVGSVLQLPMFAIAAWVFGFLIVAAIFLGAWLYLLNLRHELVGSPGGVRMLIS
jgi:uncharacterized protein DUF4233